MSRLQVGALALNTKLGNVVTLKFYFNSDQLYNHEFKKLNNVWLVVDENHHIKEYCEEEKYLMPLGDEKGVELYSLKEEQKELIL
ncbi:hypothetical protein APC42_17395 [Acinetobacter pittii]|uniref:hypothetical protein n=1 Tax=Acinetobacter pittii TaxID=48296 RepID=UPI00070BD618|nr:hypothetical protein [Acinetobacter pittii]KRI46500.1 hypothetical protein APC42_17395 [Acinetobacter pittii]